MMAAIWRFVQQRTRLTEEQAPTLAPKPTHVPYDFVRDFDFYNIKGSQDDVQAAYAAVQQTNPRHILDAA